jgi:outer membrane protein assembly factor BamB
VYHDSFDGLQVLDRATGALLASMTDPAPASGTIRPLFPILGGRGNVVVFVGEAVHSPELQWGPRRLASFDVSTRAWSWTTPTYYQGIPAVAGGVVYATRNAPMALDAIDEATGTVLWSWAPSDPADTAFATDNIVATKNVLFVGTDRHTYAIDLATRQAAWRTTATGALAISAGRTLYIANTTAGLTAVRLQ